MKVNEGTVDRALRVIAGLALIAFALFSGSEYAKWGFVGIVPLLTGLVGICPVYSIFGLSTCPIKR